VNAVISTNFITGDICNGKIIKAPHPTMDKLAHEWKKDTVCLDLMQEVAKFYYFQERYDKLGLKICA
jgi:hypothetical protein